MLPEAKLIKGEITLREMALPADVKLSKKSLIRWLALALGLISPKESRQTFLALFEVLLDAHIRGERLTANEIIERVKEMAPVDDKTIYYHLKRLQKAGLVSRESGEYFFGDGFERDLMRIIRRAYRERSERAFEAMEEAIRSLAAGRETF